MWTTLAALGLIALGVALEGILTVSGPWSFGQSGVVISLDPSRWTQLTNIQQFWFKHGDPSCRLLLLTALWAYLRRLGAAYASRTVNSRDDSFEYATDVPTSNRPTPSSDSTR